MADMPEQSEQRDGSVPRWLSRRWLPPWVAALCVAAFVTVGLPTAWSPESQWDFDTYYHASKLYDAGGNPWSYRQLADAAGRDVLPFVYPHPTLVFFRLFAPGDLSAGKHAYLIAKLVCVAALCLLWTTCFVRAGARGWFLAFAMLGYNAAICRDLVAGNVSVFEQTLIWFALLALLRGRLGLFCLLIILAAQFKILPVCLLGLVLLTDAPHKWRTLAAGVVASVLIAAIVYVSNPAAAGRFLHAATVVGSAAPGGTLNPCALSLIREVADRVMGRFSVLGGISPRLAAHVAYAVFVLAVLLAFGGRVRRQHDLRRAIFLGLCTFALIAPRMKDYSYILLLVPTFELFRGRLAAPGSARLWVLAPAAMLALPGLDIVWRYRLLLLAGWTWVLALKAEPVETGGGCAVKPQSP